MSWIVTFLLGAAFGSTAMLIMMLLAARLIHVPAAAASSPIWAAGAAGSGATSEQRAQHAIATVKVSLTVRGDRRVSRQDQSLPGGCRRLPRQGAQHLPAAVRLAAQQGVPVIPVVFELLPAKRMSEAEQVRLELETVSTVEAYFNERPMFAVLAGAVFALHQDTLRAFAIDMWNIDVSLGVAMDKMRPSTLGNFPKRVRLTVDTLHQIDDFDLDQRDKYKQEPPLGTDAKEYQVQSPQLQEIGMGGGFNRAR
jgi:hypothetical protein